MPQAPDDVRVVVGNFMFFDDPEKHRTDFDMVHHDDGEIDFPAHAEYLTACLGQLEAETHVHQIHPLVSVAVADLR